VVDDEDDFRASVAMVLEDEGWEVREARHGAEALDLLRTWDPSVIMLDLRMPVMDGSEVLRRLDGHPRRPCIVLVTASPQAADLARRYRLRYHVPKPFDMERLLAVLDEAHQAA
jgi:CheY-like chemotaxis protein